VSFTFDDFPASAVEKGAAILEHYGARGTYYWSGAFMDHDDPSVDPVTWAHVQAVVARGHELACHSFSHLDCARESSATLERDLSRNKAAVLRAFRTNSPVLEHFAYPYGNVSPAARRVVARRFRTGRGIYRGINLGWADAALLSANPI
jgi:peptidoglycan/xylan/chitin deacetylase (PgdA/CDA1 family)